MLRNQKHVSLKITEAELLAENQPLSLILELSNLLSTCQNRENFLSAAISKIMEFYNLDAGRIYLLDGKRPLLRLIASKGIEISGLEIVSLSIGFTGRSARTRSFIAQHVSELDDKVRAELLINKGLKIIICVPLITKNRVVGVMNLAVKKVIPLDKDMVDTLNATGSQIAVALENYDLFEKISRKANEIQEQKEALRFFVYSTLHDLKGPSMAIHGLTKRLKDSFQTLPIEKGQTYCDHILMASEQLLDLVQKLNTYVASREATQYFEEFTLGEITETIRTEVADKLEKRGIKWFVPVGALRIKADKLSIMRIFRNLVENSLKYGGNDLDEIRIGYSKDKNFHIFSVRDNGVGIKVEDADRLFDLFQRHETSKGVEGSGLGLAIVKELVEKHDGQVWIEQGATKGVIFCFSISRNLV